MAEVALLCLNGFSLFLHRLLWSRVKISSNHIRLWSTCRVQKRSTKINVKVGTFFKACALVKQSKSSRKVYKKENCMRCDWCYIEVSILEGARIGEVSLERCLLYKGVCIREMSVLERDVCIREVSVLERDVCIREVSVLERCLY